MANSIDRLFESVLSKLPDPDKAPAPAWPDLFDDFEDVLDSQPENDGDRVSPLRTEPSFGDMVARSRELLSRESVLTELEDGEKDLVEGGLRARGIEAVAFYKSKRFQRDKPFSGKWGIFYINHGLRHLAWQISQYYPGYGDAPVLAREFLRAHEHFHFQADIQTLMLEATLQKHLYVPTRQRFRRAKSHFVEEAIANRQAYDWAKQASVGLEEFARESLLCQPNAYARFLEPITDLAGEWMANVVDGQPPLSPPRHDLAPWVQNVPGEFMRRSLCPEWIVYPQKLTDWIDPTFKLPEILEINDDDNVVKILQKKRRALRDPWEKTKAKLINHKYLPGLDFKRWWPDGPDCFSVRIDDGNRAHLRKVEGGRWKTYEIGSHDELEH